MPHSTPTTRDTANQPWIVMTPDDVMMAIGGTLGHTCYAVYHRLDRRCNKECIADVTLQTIADELSITTRTVYSAIDRLSEAGWIEVTPHRNAYNMITRNTYFLPKHWCGNGVEMPVKSLGNDVEIGVSKISDKVITSNPQVPTSNPEVKDERASVAHAEFELFWSSYPRKGAKIDAEKAWNQKQPELETILQDIEHRLGTGIWTAKSKFIPLPASYLRGERWKDERVVRVDPEIRTDGGNKNSFRREDVDRILAERKERGIHANGSLRAVGGGE